MSDTVMEPKELREAFDRVQSELQAERAQFKAYKAEVTFKENGLTPKHAKLFLATNPEGDISPETVKEFAEEYGLVVNTPTPASAQSVVPGLPEDGSPPAVERILGTGPKVTEPGISGGSIMGAAGTPQGTFNQAAPTKMSKAEFQALLESNPQEAARAYTEGRVERNRLNVQADNLSQKGIIR